MRETVLDLGSTSDNDKKYFSINICVERVVPQWSTLQIYSKDYSKEQIKYIIENFESITTTGYINTRTNPYKSLQPFKFESDVSETKIRKKSVGVRELKPPIGYVSLKSYSREEWSDDELQFRKIDRWKWDEYFSGLLEDSRKNPDFDEETFNSL